MYPAWKSSFDAHIYEGRVLQVLLMKTAEEPLAEVTVGVSVLAERCKKANGRAEFWVRRRKVRHRSDPDLWGCKGGFRLNGSVGGFGLDNLLCVHSGGSSAFGEGDDGSAVLPGRS